ncbi:MAG: hypothetical protein GY858_09265 [Candidatus Omnitrophica bacterium]|nr:hypothetical protein [Candidatus Omnitrophota bacterium]
MNLKNSKNESPHLYDTDAILSDFVILKQRIKTVFPYQWLKLFSFISGLAALIYEVIWIRIFANILGSTVFAMTCVFSVFLISLALGAYLSGKFIQKKNPDSLFAYGLTELAIAGTSLLVTCLLFQYKVKIAIFLPLSDSLLVTLFIQLCSVFLLIGLPAVLMGATLPLIISASKRWVSPDKTVAVLYGCNTIGGALGAFFCGFVFILHFGLYGTLGLAVIMNVIVAASSLLLAFVSREQTSTVVFIPKESDVKSDSLIDNRHLLTILVFFSGFMGLSFEILWGRMAKFFLGDRTLAVSSLLTIYLFCLGSGSFFASYLYKLQHKIKRLTPCFLLVLITASSGLAHLIFVGCAHWIIHEEVFRNISSPFCASFLRLILSFGVMAIPVTITGMIFPLILSNVRNINIDSGAVVGRVYFINTAGSALGGVFAGYLLSRTIGTIGGFYLLSLTIIVASLCLLMYCKKGLIVKIIFVSILLSAFMYQSFQFPISLVKLSADEQIIALNEDEYGIQVISRLPGGLICAKNNRLQLVYYLGVKETSYVQQMQAHLPMLYSNNCKKVLNIGTGYGITAGAFSLYDKIESIETVEILPFLAQSQSVFSEYNFKYYEDPRIKLVIDDGRHYLNSKKDKYDIISVNVLDPYLPGSASLFTINFWKEVKSHLQPAGVMVQLIWGKDVALLVRGLRRVFSKVLLFPAYPGSFNVLAFNVPEKTRLIYDVNRLSESAKLALEDLEITDPDMFFHYAVEATSLISEKYIRSAGEVGRRGKLHTDNYPVLEYQWLSGGGSIFDSLSSAD